MIITKNIHLSKMLSARSLSSKLRSAIKGKTNCKVAFEELDASVGEEQSMEWREEERMAIESRGEYLRIYEVRTNKGRHHNSFCIIFTDFPGSLQLLP